MGARTGRIGAGLMALGVFTLVSATDTIAQEQEREYNNRRELAGHTFIPSNLVGDPFIASYIRSSTGAGVATGVEIPIRDVDGNVLTVLQGDLAFLLLEFEYQQALGSWVALRLGGSASARLGTNEETILAQGINAVYGMNLGATVKLLKSERVMLSAVADYRTNKIYAFNLFDFLQKVIEDGFDPEADNSLLTSGPTSVTTVGLKAAYSPWRWLGLVASGEGGGGSPFREDIDGRGVFTGGLSADVDFGAISSVPIGLQWVFNWSNFSDNNSDILDTIVASGFTVGFTGREDFFLGLTTGFNRVTLLENIPGTDSNTLDGSTLSLVLRYFF
jgi:hypothetical protein